MSDRPRIVVFSTLFPNAVQPGAGIFIRERMFRVAKELPLMVVAPVPWFPFQGLIRAFRPHFRPLPPKCEIQDGIEVLHPRFFSVPGILKSLDGIFLALSTFILMRRLQLEHRFDIIDCHFAYPDGYAGTRLGKWLGVPVTITLRGTEARHSNDPRLRPLLARALRSSARVFSVSQSLRRHAINLGIPESKICVVGNGVDIEKFHPVARSDARSKLRIDVDAPVLISIGGLVERKGFHRVIECLPELKIRFPKLVYLIVGGASAEGDMRPQLENQVVALGLQDTVRFLGSMPADKLKWPLCAADIFVLATRNEGWANVFLEAMACGLPVITTDVGGNAEVVCRDELGTIVPFGDRAALRESLATALSQQWDRAAIVRYAEGNDWNKRVAILVEEFTALHARTRVRLPHSPLKNMYTALAAHILFPLHERLKHHTTVAVRLNMEQTQWWETQRLDALRLKRLRALLIHAQIHVPYYRDLFVKTGIDPGNVHDLADLAKLPFLTKAEIRANQETLKADTATGLARFNTGGSSGEPLIFFIGNERVSHDVAAKWRATRWWGVDIGDPEIVVWGSPIELGSQDRMRMLRDKLLRTRLLPAFEMSAQKLDVFIEEIRAMRPKMLFGYPSAISHIARHAEERGIAMNDLGIKVAFVTSERLYDHQRETIQRVFGCPVANGYGGRDAGFIAHQCPSGGMHITAEDIIVETVDANGNATPSEIPGEIVVTHLATSDFPFIRYKTGDMGVLTDELCLCGRGLPLLKEIQGRTTDFVMAQDGTVMHGLALIYVVRDLPGVREFKIVQESLDFVRVLIATDADFAEASLNSIADGIKQRLGSGVTVKIERVTEVPKEASGKFRYIISHVEGMAETPAGMV